MVYNKETSQVIQRWNMIVEHFVILGACAFDAYFSALQCQFSEIAQFIIENQSKECDILSVLNVDANNHYQDVLLTTDSQVDSQVKGMIDKIVKFRYMRENDDIEYFPRGFA